MKNRVLFLIVFSFIVISCKDGNKHNNESLESDKQNIDIATVDNIGTWTMPINDHINNHVTLKYDLVEGKYYTIEKLSNANRTDSLGVIIKKDELWYYIEYMGATKDSFTIDETGTVVWHCPGYDSVKCPSSINMNNLSETFLLYKPSPKIIWVATSMSTDQSASLFNWSKEYVKVCVFNPESLVFPDINDVTFYSRADSCYKIEYKATGNDLYNNTVTYPVNIIFESPEHPIFHSISLE